MTMHREKTTRGEAITQDMKPASDTGGMATGDGAQLVTTKEVLTDLKWFIGISVSVLLAFLGYLFTMVNGLAGDLRSHKENSEIHRTREEVLAKEKAEVEWKEYVKESLRRIEQKVDAGR